MKEREEDTDRARNGSEEEEEDDEFICGSDMFKEPEDYYKKPLPPHTDKYVRSVQGRMYDFYE